MMQMDARLMQAVALSGVLRAARTAEVQEGRRRERRLADQHALERAAQRPEPAQLARAARQVHRHLHGRRAGRPYPNPGSLPAGAPGGCTRRAGGRRSRRCALGLFCHPRGDARAACSRR